jgi:hypothetical protein
MAFNNSTSGANTVKSIMMTFFLIALSFDLHPDSGTGTFGCWTDQVQSRIVVKQDHRISKVPRLFGEETKLTMVGGSVQFALKCVMPWD